MTFSYLFTSFFFLSQNETSSSDYDRERPTWSDEEHYGADYSFANDMDAISDVVPSQEEPDTTDTAEKTETKKK